jgi:hypothetical protein
MRTDDDDMPGWSGNLRDDGVHVYEHEGRWVIAVDEANHVWLCPCCDRDMLTSRAAKLVADAEYPLRRPS